jgi:hypothetical protein
VLSITKVRQAIDAARDISMNAQTMDVVDTGDAEWKDPLLRESFAQVCIDVNVLLFLCVFCFNATLSKKPYIHRTQKAYFIASRAFFWRNISHGGGASVSGDGHENVN